MVFVAEKSRRKAFGLFLATTLALVPTVLAFNIWGTALAQRMDMDHQCVFLGMAQSMQLLYLISTFCAVFIYAVFLVTVRECTQRYFLAMDLNPAILRQSFNPSGFNISIVKGRSQQDWCDALAYTFWFLRRGRVGSPADRNYIQRERANRLFQWMTSSLK